MKHQEHCTNRIYQLEKVNYCYTKSLPALLDIDLRITAGERVAILGPNGCGKSTLLQLLDGLIFPNSGTIEALGSVLTEKRLEEPDFRHLFRGKIGLLFQDSEVQLFSATVRDELAFGPRQLQLSDEEITMRIDDLVMMFNFNAILDRSPMHLSGGEKKKVALASLLSTAPEVLLLDEPNTGLDPRSRHWLNGFLRELADAGKTIILATHDLALAGHIATRAIILGEDHKIAADGPLPQLLADHELLARCNLIEPVAKADGATQIATVSPATYPFAAPCKKRPF